MKREVDLSARQRMITGLLVVFVASAGLANLIINRQRSLKADPTGSLTNSSFGAQYPVGFPNGAAATGIIVETESDLPKDAKNRTQRDGPSPGPDGNILYSYKNFYNSATLIAYPASNTDYIYSTKTNNRGEYFVNLPAGAYYLCAFAPDMSDDEIPKRYSDLPAAYLLLCVDDQARRDILAGKITLIEAVSNLAAHEDFSADRMAISHNLGILRVITKQRANEPFPGVNIKTRCANPVEAEGRTDWDSSIEPAETAVDFTVFSPPLPQTCTVTATAPYSGDDAQQTKSVEVAQSAKLADGTWSKTKLIFNFFGSVTPSPETDLEPQAPLPAQSRLDQFDRGLARLFKTLTAMAQAPLTDPVNHQTLTVFRNTTKKPVPAALTDPTANKERAASVVAGTAANESGNIVKIPIKLVPQTDTYDNVSGALAPRQTLTALSCGGVWQINQPRFVVNQDNRYQLVVDTPGVELKRIMVNGDATNQISLAKSSRSTNSDGTTDLTPYQTTGIKIVANDNRTGSLAGRIEAADSTSGITNTKGSVTVTTSDPAATKTYAGITSFDYSVSGHPRVGYTYMIVFTPEDPILEVAKIYRDDCGVLTALGSNRIALTESDKHIELVIKLKKKSPQLFGRTETLAAGQVVGNDLKGNFTLKANDLIIKTFTNTDSFNSNAATGHPKLDTRYSLSFVPTNSAVTVDGYYRADGSKITDPNNIVLTGSDIVWPITVKLTRLQTTLSVTIADRPAPPAPAGPGVPPTGGNPNPQPGDPFQLYRINQGETAIPIVGDQERRQLFNALKKVNATTTEIWTILQDNSFAAALVDYLNPTRVVKSLGRTNVSSQSAGDVIGTYKLNLTGTNNFGPLCVVSQEKRSGKFFTDYRRYTTLSTETNYLGPMAIRAQSHNPVTVQHNPTTANDSYALWLPDKLSSPTKLTGQVKNVNEINNLKPIVSEPGTSTTPVAISVTKVKQCLN